MSPQQQPPAHHGTPVLAIARRSDLAEFALSLLAALLAGLVAGWAIAYQQHASKRLADQAAGEQRYARAVDDGAQSVDRLQGQVGDIAAHAAYLEAEILHAPIPLLLVPRAPDHRCAAAVPVPAGASAGRAAAAADVPAAPPEPAIAAADPAASAVAAELSWSAVRLWDSALAGGPVAAGACTAADPAAPVCAAGSGLGLEAAWRNHVVNTSLCAQDRAQLAELIALVQRRQALTQQAHP